MEKYINLLLLWLLAFSSCVDEEIISNVKEGEDVTVSLNLYLPNPSQITTRAITSTEEAKVEVLKILVFDNKGNYLPERSVSSVKVESSEQTVDDNGGSLIAKKIPMQYLQPIITQYFIDNKSEIWLLFLIAHSKR